MPARAVAALLVLLAAALPLGCGGDDDEPQNGGGERVVFPEGGSVPDERELSLEDAASAAGCELKTTPSRGPEDGLHTQGPDERVRYRGNPPTLGRHWPPGYQAQDGLYDEAPADEALVHTMEHGRVILWAKPDLRREARMTLRALFVEDSYQLVLTPRANMPYAVAATAWNGEPGPEGTGRTLGCAEWSQQAVHALRAFRDEHRSRGPEAVP